MSKSVLREASTTASIATGNRLQTRTQYTFWQFSHLSSVWSLPYRNMDNYIRWVPRGGQQYTMEHYVQHFPLLWKIHFVSRATCLNWPFRLVPSSSDTETGWRSRILGTIPMRNDRRRLPCTACIRSSSTPDRLFFSSLLFVEPKRKQKGNKKQKIKK